MTGVHRINLWARKLLKKKFLLYKLLPFGLAVCIWYIYSRSKGNKQTDIRHRDLTCPELHGLVTDLTRQQNIDYIKKYQFPGTNFLNFNDYFGLDDKVENSPRDVPVIGTASSSNHFVESLLLLEHLEKTLFLSYGALRVYYYDIGLSNWQRKRVMEYSRVEIRQFPFFAVPDHVRKLNGYAWKPIIIQMLLREFGFVMWMDASVRFTSSNQEDLFMAAKEHAIIYRPGFYNLVIHTDRDTFSFLKEDPCIFSNQNEIEANFIIIYRTQFTNDFFMKPAVLCALSFGCMVTDSSEYMIDCSDKTNPHTCHRFDQSVFTILISRLYRNERTNQLPAYSEVQLCRGAEVSILGEAFNRILVRLIYWWTSTSKVCL